VASDPVERTDAEKDSAKRKVGTMIRDRRSNRVRDVVGVVVLLVTATLLWVDESVAKDLPASVEGTECVVEVVAPL